MSTFIAIPSDAYQTDKGLALVQKHITQLGGSWEVETETIEREGKPPVVRRRLRVTADDKERVKKTQNKEREIPLPSIAGEIRWYLETQYLWKVEDV